MFIYEYAYRYGKFEVSAIKVVEAETVYEVIEKHGSIPYSVRILKNEMGKVSSTKYAKYAYYENSTEENLADFKHKIMCELQKEAYDLKLQYDVLIFAISEIEDEIAGG